jgi:adenylate cyclase
MIKTDAVFGVRDDASSLPGAFGQDAESENLSLAESPGLRTGLTIDDVAHPAYMVNYNLELTWCNESARKQILQLDALPPGTESRNIFRLLAQATNGNPGARRGELTRLYLSLAKLRLSKAALLGIVESLEHDVTAFVDAMYEQSGHLTRKVVIELPCTLDDGAGSAQEWRVYGIYFREGILIIHVPAGVVDPNLLEFISRRDIVVRNLLRKQLPVFTPLVVLVADLQDAARIRSELPAEDCMRLRGEIWSAMAPVFRKYCGTNSKQVGDRMLCYFLPQPDSNYVLNAVACAHELKMEMRNISRRWRLDRRWSNELRLEPLLHERQEWFGTFESASSVEFAAAGETVCPEAKPGDVGRVEAVWSAGNLVNPVQTKEPAAATTEHRETAAVHAGFPTPRQVRPRGRSLAAMWRAAEYRAPAHA